MKIAVPTNDGVTICGHFGRCREFLVFEIQDGRARLADTRPNAGCPGHGAGAGHGGFVELLRDCQVVLCAGIGAGALEALGAAGIRAVTVNEAGNAEQLVMAYQAGTIAPVSTPSCNCRH